MENIEKIKELVEFLLNTNDKDLFIAQIIKEKVDYKADIIDISTQDIEYAEKIYEECYMENDYENSKWNESITEALNGEFNFEEEEEEALLIIKDIKCQVCGKSIGVCNIKTNEVVEIYEDYNTCDKCGREICFNCTITIDNENDDFNGCYSCYQELKKVEKN